MSAQLPQPLPNLPEVPEARDIDFPGRIELAVDATDVLRGILRCDLVIACNEGSLTLLFPKWLPGYHAPQAPIELLAGLEVIGGGEKLRWIRHPVTINAFQIDVPAGVRTLNASFQFLSPTDAEQGRVTVTPNLLMLQWNTVLLYPAGHFARRIRVLPRIRLPNGWSFATALPVAGERDGWTWFEETHLDRLVDSPLMSGCNFRKIDLDDDGSVTLNMVADRPELLDAPPEQIEPHRALVKEVDKLFGTRHFPRYDILLALSDVMSQAGVEHHRSCEAVSASDYFTNWDALFPRRDTIAHEYIHSWNGKHRRGADSWSPCFEKPIRNSLMWVYEGLTQYLSRILCARAGLWTATQARDAFAIAAALQQLRPGSRWRPMIDTTRDPIIAARAPLPWSSWQRSEDYYSEGQLLWLDVDTLIRELSNDTRSLDDFVRGFFGARHAGRETDTYSFEDVVTALSGCAPYDWKRYFEEQLTETRDGAPLGGLRRGGYDLVFLDHPSDFALAMEDMEGIADLSFSLGLSVKTDGSLVDVVWDGPAFDGQLTVGARIIAVNGTAFSVRILKDAVAGSRENCAVELVVEAARQVRPVRMAYDGGHRYPHLRRAAGERRRLDAIMEPRR